MEKREFLPSLKDGWTRKAAIVSLAVLAFLIPYTSDSFVVLAFLGSLTIAIALLGMDLCARRMVLGPWQKALFFSALAYGVYFALAVMVSPANDFRMLQWGWLLSGLALLVSVVFTAPSRREARTILISLVAGGVISGALGVWQYLRTGVHAHGLATMNSNTFGGYLVAVAPVAIAWFFAARGKWERLLAGAGFLIVVAALIFTFCRGSIVALFAAGFCISWWLRSCWIVPGLGSYYYILSKTIAPSAYQRFAPLVTGTLDSSSTSRLQLWRAALELWKTRPVFGVGIGRYRLLAPDLGLPKTAIFEFGSKGRHSLSCHNSYLEILAEQGLTGLTILLALLVVFFFPVLRRLFVPDFRSKPIPYMGAGLSKSGFIAGRKPADPWLAGMAGGVVGFLVHNLTNSLFLYNGVSWAGWLLLGLAVCRVKTEGEGGEPACVS